MDISCLRTELKNLLSRTDSPSLSESETLAVREITALLRNYQSMAGSSLSGDFRLQNRQKSGDFFDFERKFSDFFAKFREEASDPRAVDRLSRSFFGLIFPSADVWVIIRTWKREWFAPSHPQGLKETVSSILSDVRSKSFRVMPLQMYYSGFEESGSSARDNRLLSVITFQSREKVQGFVLALEESELRFLKQLSKESFFEGLVTGFHSLLGALASNSDSHEIKEGLFLMERTLIISSALLFEKVAAFRETEKENPSFSSSVFSEKSRSKSETFWNPQREITHSDLRRSLEDFRSMGLQKFLEEAGNRNVILLSLEGKVIGKIIADPFFESVLELPKADLGNELSLAVKSEKLSKILREVIETPKVLLAQPFFRISVVASGVRFSIMPDQVIASGEDFGFLVMIGRESEKAESFEEKETPSSSEASQTDSPLELTVRTSLEKIQFLNSPFEALKGFQIDLKATGGGERSSSKPPEKLRSANSVLSDSSEEEKEPASEDQETIVAEYTRPSLKHRPTLFIQRNLSFSKDGSFRSNSEFAASKSSKLLKLNRSESLEGVFEEVEFDFLDDFDSADFFDKEVKFLFGAVWSMLRTLGVIERFGLCPKSLQAYLKELLLLYGGGLDSEDEIRMKGREKEEERERERRSVRNFARAVSVMHSLYWMLRHSPFLSLFDDVGVLALIFAALIQKVDRRGKTNSFEVKNRSILALRYNDRSVLENHSCSVGFSLLRKEGLNFLSGMDSQEFLMMKELAIAFVLMNDPCNHLSLRHSLKTAWANHPFEEFSHQKSEERFRLLGASALFAVSSTLQARPFDQAARWSDLARRELIDLAEFEERRGLPATPALKNLVRDPIAYFQEVVFLSVIAVPAFEDLNALLSDSLAPLLTHLRANLRTWEMMLDQETELSSAK